MATRCTAPGLDKTTAQYMAALDASLALDDLRTTSQDLTQLLGRPATPVAEVVRAAYHVVAGLAGGSTVGFSGAENIDGKRS
jgi:hypothetical protein